MTHYTISNAVQRAEDSIQGITLEQYDNAVDTLTYLLDRLMAGELKKIRLDDCDSTVEDGPRGFDESVAFYDSQGLKAKMVNDELFAGTNGDWVLMSHAFDAVGIDWRSRFEV